MEYINKVICGDCEEVLKNFSEESVNLIFTSPPYLDISNKYNNGYKGPDSSNYCDWFLPKVSQFSRVLKNDGSFLLNLDTKTENRFKNPYIYKLIDRIVNETNFKLFEVLYWDKLKGLPIRNRFYTRVEQIFWFAKNKDFKFYVDEFRTKYSPVSINRMKSPIKKRFARTQQNQNDGSYKEWQPHPKGSSPSNLIKISSESQRICNSHVACFPVKLAEHFIKGCTDLNDIILDPFAGTFSSCLAAKNLGRNYCGIDISQEYCDFGLKRLDNI